MIRTKVSGKDGGWWFEWWNMAGGKEVAYDRDGPFRAKEEAERARENFVRIRKQRYAHESFESE